MTDACLQDLIHAGRALRRSPLFTAVTIVTLAVGIGTTMAAYALADAVLWRPLAGIAAPDRLFALYGDLRETAAPEYQGLSYPDFLDYRETGVAPVAAYVRLTLVSRARGNANQLVVDFASGDYFNILGTTPAAGRLLTGADDRPGAVAVAVISTRIWRDYFDQDPGVAGKMILVGDRPLTVVGVAPEGFRGPLLDWYGERPIDAVVPIAMLDRFVGRAILADRRWTSLMVVGRLRPGARREDAHSVLASVSQRLEREHADTNRGRTVIALPSHRARFFPARWTATTRLLTILLAAHVGLLLIACCNVGVLLYNRSRSRRDELALRRALGGKRLQVARPLIFEVLVIVIASTGIGMLVAVGCLALLAAYPAPFQVPLYSGLAVDGRAAACGVALGATILVLFMLLTLWWTSAAPILPQMKSARVVHTTRASAATRTAVVGVQACLSVVLLTSAAFFAMNLRGLVSADLGFARRGVTIVWLDAGLADGGQADPNVALSSLLFRTRQLHAVRSVGLGEPPLGTLRVMLQVAVPPDLPPRPFLSRAVSAGYFETLGIGLRAGRYFTDDPSDTQTAVVVGQSMAAALWPGDPIGRQIQLPGDPNPRVVVGVVRDTPYNAVGEQPQPTVFVPLFRGRAAQAALLVRSDLPAGELLTRLQAEIRNVAPQMAVVRAMPIEAYLASQMSRQHVAARVSLGLAGAAVLLVILGVYGLVAQLIQEREHDLGVRMALGADARRLVLGVVARAGAIAVVAAVAGALAWRSIAQVLQPESRSVAANGPLLIVTVAAAVVLMVLVSAYWPARRIVAMDPCRALRAE